jgi:hypothetical protein
MYVWPTHSVEILPMFTLTTAHVFKYQLETGKQWVTYVRDCEAKKVTLCE